MGILSSLFQRQVYYVKFSAKEISPRYNENYVHWHKRAMKENLNYARKCLSVKPLKEEAWLFVRDSIFSYIEAAKHAANLQEKDVVNDILLELSSHRNLYESIIVYDGFDDEDNIEWNDLFDEDLKNLENYTGFKYVYFLKNLDSHISRPTYEKPKHRPNKPFRGKLESAQYFRFRNIKYKRDVKEWDKLINMAFPKFPERKKCISDWEYHKKKCEYVDLFVVWAEAQKDKDISQVDRLKGYIKPKVPIREEGELVDNFYLRIVQYRKDMYSYDIKTLKPQYPMKFSWETEESFMHRKKMYDKNIVECFRKGGSLVKPTKKPDEYPAFFQNRLGIYKKEKEVYDKIQSEMKPKDKICLTMLYRERNMKHIVLLFAIIFMASCSSSFKKSAGIEQKKGTVEKTVSASGNVYVCTGGSSKCYHCDRDCKGLSRCSGEIEEVTEEEAEDMGRTPCKICY